MFFNLSTDKKTNFSSSYYFSNNFVLSTDLGWKESRGPHGKIVYKGYINGDLQGFLRDLDPTSVDMPAGSFTAIMEENDNIFIKHDNNRSYPIYSNNKKCELTNLRSHDNDTNKLWYDHLLQVNTTKKMIKVSLQERDNTIDHNYVSLENTCDKIFNMLNTEIQQFSLYNKDPIKIVPTCGIDNTLVMGLLRYNKIPFEVIDYEYKKWSYFFKKNRRSLINTHGELFLTDGFTWGDQPVIVANGYHADQYFLRDYIPLYLVCKQHDLDLDSIAEKYQASYTYKNHVEQRNDYQNRLSSIIEECDRDTNLYEKVYEILNGTYLLWHLEETTYWSPFKNSSITKHILSMPIEHIVDNAFNVTIQKRLLEKAWPEFSQVVTEEKNVFSKDTFVKALKILRK
jgi:hypothetical protein